MSRSAAAAAASSRPAAARSTRTAAAKTPRQATAKGGGATPTAAAAVAVSSAPVFDYERVPLAGRSAEFEAVISFVHERQRQEHGRALFVFGACGCGKTSTVLRAMRSFHARPLPCDRQICSRDDEAGGGGHGCAVAGSKRGRTASVTKRPTTAKVEGSPHLSGCSSARTSAGHQCGGSTATVSDDSPQSAGHNSARSSTGTGGKAVGGPLFPTSGFLDGSSSDGDEKDNEAGKDPMAYYYAQYPALYSAVVKADGTSRVRAPPAAAAPAQAHYVNCADLSPQQLAEAIQESLGAAYPRPTAAVAAFTAHIMSLADRGKQTRNSGVAVAVPTATTSSSSSRRPAAMPLQVLVLDEVEYLRPAARATLTSLATLSFSQGAPLALICISNQRDLVHVPQMLLDELAFAPYTALHLREICAIIASDEIEKRFVNGSAATSSTTATTTTTTTVTISPSLHAYIANKALSEYAGDVRQVAAMCRRAVYAAHEEWAAARAQQAKGAEEEERERVQSEQMRLAASARGRGGSKGRAKVGRGRGAAAAAAPAATTRKRAAAVDEDLATRLEAAVDAYRPDGTGHGARPSSSPSSSSSQPSSAPSSTRSSAGPQATTTTTAAAATQVDRNRCAVSLASSKKVMAGAAGEDELQQFVSTTPLQMLYLLACLVVLFLRRLRDHSRAKQAIGGYLRGHATGAASSAPTRQAANSIALTARGSHDLYTRLMGRYHFPPMNGTGVTDALGYFADRAIITRPGRRGNEEVFSFTGNWTLEALEAALIARGEELRRELEACGLDGSDNRFTSAMLELKTMLGLIM